MYRLVFRGERGFLQSGLGDNDAIEGIACPGLALGALDDFGKGMAAELEPDGGGEFMNDLGRRCLGSADLVEVLKFQTNHRRYQDVACLERVTDSRREEVLAAGVQPGHDVGIEIDYGRHSFDQSMCTNASGFTAR